LYPNPSINNDRLPAFILQREFRLFKNTDPEEKHQKAIPISVISELIHRDGTDLERATVELPYRPGFKNRLMFQDVTG